MRERFIEKMREKFENEKNLLKYDMQGVKLTNLPKKFP